MGSKQPYGISSKLNSETQQSREDGYIIGKDIEGDAAQKSFIKCPLYQKSTRFELLSTEVVLGNLGCYVTEKKMCTNKFGLARIVEMEYKVFLQFKSPFHHFSFQANLGI